MIAFVLNGCGYIDHVPEALIGTVLGVNANPVSGVFVDAG